MMYADAVAKAAASLPPWEAPMASTRSPCILLARNLHGTPLATEDWSASLAWGGQIFRMIRLRAEEQYAISLLLDYQARHVDDATRRLLVNEDELPIIPSPQATSPRVRWWVKVEEVVMVGATFHGVRIPGTINGMGFINALRGGNLLSFEWFSCCTCGRLLPYDTRHELLECSIHPGGSTLGEMARLIQPIITLLSPGFQAEGDSRERDWQLADGALERALRVTVEVLQGKQLVARGTPGGDGLWEVVRATLSGHLPRPGPSTRAFISTSNRVHLKGEDAHTYWVEKEVCRHISRAASLGAAIVNEGIQRRTSKRVPSDANHLVINNGKLDCRDAIRTRDAARATAPAPNIPTPPKLKPPSPSQPVPSMHCDIDRDGEASSVSRKCTFCPCEVDVGKRQCTLCISIRCDFCQSERWEREVDGTHICGACLADKCISCGMVDPIAVTPSGLCFTCVRDPAISAAATATPLALAAAIAAAAAFAVARTSSRSMRSISCGRTSCTIVSVIS